MSTYWVIKMDSDGIGFSVESKASSKEQAIASADYMLHNDPSLSPLTIVDDARLKQIGQREAFCVANS